MWGIEKNRTRRPDMAGGIDDEVNEIRGIKEIKDFHIKAFVRLDQRGKKMGIGGGLHLFITPAGTPTWRIKYRLDGREKLYSIGTYPQVGLSAARAQLREVKDLLRAGRDPVVSRRLDRAEAAASSDNTFEVVAGQWLAMKAKEWSSGHHKKSERALARDVYPSLGKLPIAGITPAMVAKTIEDINQRDVLETATRILQHLNGVFRYAQAKGLCRDNPATPAREVLPRKKDSGRMPALLDLRALGEILRKAEAARLSPSVRMAHRLCAFAATRIGNVVEAEWKEFHLDDEQPMWIIPRAKMKVDSRDIDHRVPLAPEIASELRQWRQICGSRQYAFPSPATDKHISRESIEKAYRITLGLKDRHAPHGWRSSFSTLARDNGFARDVVELALDHAHDNEVVRAYDRGERFAERIKLYQWWGRQLWQAQYGATVVPIAAAA